jgi:hypothetical protein
MLGRDAEGMRHLEQYREFIQGYPDDRWRWTSYHSHRTLALALSGEWGEPFEESVRAHAALKVSPKRTPLTLLHFYVGQAYGRLRQLQRASSAERKKSLEKMQQALHQMLSVARQSTVKAHSLWIQAAVDRMQGRAKRAALGLNQAETLAQGTGNRWALAEVSLERARIKREATGAVTASEIDPAREFFREVGWRTRQQEVADEFAL